MYLCPHCHQALAESVGANGVTWQCATCGGQAMGFGVVRKTVGPQHFAEALSQVVTTNDRDGCTCPICSLPMSAATIEVEDQDVTLDLCQPCGFVWFDAGELEVIPPGPPSAPCPRRNRSIQNDACRPRKTRHGGDPADRRAGPRPGSHTR